MLVVRILAFILGAAVVLGTLYSATETFVLPRSASDLVARAVFRTNRRLFDFAARAGPSYAARDRIMALYAPVSLLLLDAVWLVLALGGFMAMYWAVGAVTWRTAFTASGSSLLTLGFAPVAGVVTTVLTFAEAVVGLTLVALLIAYLPTIYAAFSRREAAVTMLEVRAGSPPSALTMIERYHRIHGLDHLHDLWVTWEAWFAEVDESHTSLAALTFFRSPSPDRSWVTAAGAILDGASLAASTLDLPRDAQRDLCIRAGFLALRHIADFFKIPYNPDPAPSDPISVKREEFDEACDRLAQSGVPLKPDRDQAWRDFAGWRVNYDTVLLALASLTVAPPGAMWSTDRVPARRLGPVRAVAAAATAPTLKRG
jgi:hypothetical protein